MTDEQKEFYDDLLMEQQEQMQEKKMRKEILNILKEWKSEAGVKSIILVGAYPDASRTIKICTSRPGLMIGKGGETYDKYKKKLKAICPRMERIEFIETDNCWHIR